MQIGIDIRAIGRQRTGDETYTRELVRHLLGIDKHNRYFLYTNTDDPRNLQAIREKLGIDEQSSQAVLVPVLPATKMLWTFWSLPRHLAKHPIDVLHVQYITPLWLPKDIALVTTVHDISFHLFPQHIKKTDLLLLKSLIPLSLWRADKVVGVSQFTKQEITKHYGLEPEKVAGIDNGVQEDFFEPVTAEKVAMVRQKYQLPGRYIFYVGTHQPRKNLPFLIRGFKALKEQHAGEPGIDATHLVIGGKRHGHNYDHCIDDTLDQLTIYGKPWQEFIHFPGFISFELVFPNHRQHIKQAFE